MIFAGLSERRREMAILRSLGAPSIFVAGLFALEALIMTLFALILATILLYVGLFIAQPIIDKAFGLYIPITGFTVNELAILGAVLISSLLVTILPCYRAYNLSLSDGLSIRS